MKCFEKFVVVVYKEQDVGITMGESLLGVDGKRMKVCRLWKWCTQGVICVGGGDDDVGSQMKMCVVRWVHGRGERGAKCCGDGESSVIMGRMMSGGEGGVRQW